MTEQFKVHHRISARVPTPEEEFQLHLFSSDLDDKEHLALVLGDVLEAEDVLVRVHSECFTGDVLGSLRCDCGDQLRLALKVIAENGSGVLIYLRQEGRGIGLPNKLRAYNLQDQGYDTVDANLLLGHQPDERDYDIAAAILTEMGVRSVRLLTNNPQKIEGLKSLGVRVSGRLPLQGTVTAENRSYLSTKRSRLHHLLKLGQAGDSPEPAFNHNHSRNHEPRA